MIAKSVIRDDPVRSIVELVTNADDSFIRLNKSEFIGRITVGISRGHDTAYLIVSDNAEGFPVDKMDECVGGYGFETSGFEKGLNVRGLFGRGLKEAIMGLGTGLVRSIHNGMYYECRLDSYGNYESNDPRKATGKDYNELYLHTGENGTQVVIEIQAKDNNIKIPRFENLKTALQKHVSIRDIMMSKYRIVTLTDINQNITEVLSYKLPVGTMIYSELGIEVPGYPEAKVDIEVWRAEEELSQKEDGYMRDGGLLVRSGHAIHDATLFKFDDEQYARRFFGVLRCEYINKLIKKGEAVISDKRDGLEPTHQFVIVLKLLIEEILEPLVNEERKLAEAERRQLETEKTLSRFQKAIEKLNIIAKDELQSAEGPVQVIPSKKNEEGIGKPLVVFQFVPPYVQIVTGKRSYLYLKAAVPNPLPDGTKIMVESDNEEVTMITKEAILNESEAINGVVTCRIQVEGRQVGTIATVSARTMGLKATVMVKVISRKIINPPPPPSPPKAGLFKEIKFNDVDAPTQRAFYDKNTGIIEIYTKSESVGMYLGSDGKNQEKPYCQVLIAELVTDVICRALAKKREEKGLLLIPSEEAKLDAIDREHERLRAKYAAIIHQVLVDPSIHREKLQLSI